jgi:hypothetical protein
MTDVAFAPRSFDAVVAFWTLIHVPRAFHPALFARIHGWVRPGGVFAGTLGSGDNPAEHVQDFYGAPMTGATSMATPTGSSYGKPASNSSRPTRSRTKVKRPCG